MISLFRPDADRLRAFLDAQRTGAFTYAAVGATETGPPGGFVVDHTRVRLSDGERAFLAARDALRAWDHFRLGWVEAWPMRVPIAPGETVAVIARLGPVWWVNACRIVYAIDRSESTRRFGFAYGTLPDHAECGEERFMVEHDPRDDSVHYDILAFSRPRHLLAKVGYPLARRMQRRFARDSAAAMARAVVERTR